MKKLKNGDIFRGELLLELPLQVLDALAIVGNLLAHQICGVSGAWIQSHGHIVG